MALIIYTQNKYLFNNMLSAFAFFQVLYNEKKEPIDFRYLSINESFTNITHFKKEQIIGKTLIEILFS